MAREAERIHREARNLRAETAKRLMAVRLFCAANDIDFEEVRTEAKGHGPREARAV